MDTYWNNLYTAITRAMENVYIVQEKRHAISNITNFLLKEMIERHVNSQVIAKASDEERQALADRLEKSGHQEQARHISENLNKRKNFHCLKRKKKM